jgi:hypothetical protein
MRFDPARAADTSRDFGFGREPGSEGSRKAADLVADAFGKSGYHVERVPVIASAVNPRLRVAVAWLLTLCCFLMSLRLRVRGQGSTLGRLSWVLAGLAVLFLGRWALEFVDRRCVKRVQTENVEATRLPDQEAPVRVVFATALDTPRPLRPPPLERVGERVVTLVFILVVILNWFDRSFAAYINMPVLEALFGACFLGFVLWLYGMARSQCVEGESDNRDGLAFLLELGRTWPKGTDRRIETRFVVTGGQALDLAGLRTLVHHIRETWPCKPTLLIGLRSPGLGPPFELWSSGFEPGLSLESAAEALWIPHTRASRSLVRRSLWPFGTDAPEFAAIVGAGSPHVRPESLALASQLATEFALRWAKHQASAASQAGGETLARSSQNPG